MSDRANAPTWLFSFVDIAFLLLIAVTQLIGSSALAPLELGEIEVPRIRTDASTPLAAADAERWQLQVHPPSSDAPARFALVRMSENEGAAERLDLAALDARLQTLRDSDASKPLLAPHEDARAADLLNAAELLGARWPRERRAAIAPVAAGPRR